MNIKENIAKLSPTSKWSYALLFDINGKPELVASRWIGGKGYGKRRKEKVSIQKFENWETARAASQAIVEVKTDKGPGQKIVNKNCALERARAILKRAG